MMNFHVSPHSLPVHLKSATTVGVDSPMRPALTSPGRAENAGQQGLQVKAQEHSFACSVLCENTHPGSSPEERAD